MAKVYGIEPIEQIDSKSSYLLLINPEKIPHLVFIQNGLYYSLTYAGAEIAQEFKLYYQKLKRLKKKLLFVKLNYKNEFVEDYFKRHLVANTTDTSCFVPVKEMILPNSDAQMIFELIPDLYNNQIIEGAYHFGMENLINSKGEFELSSYTKEMVFLYIKHLKNKDAARKKNKTKTT